MLETCSKCSKLIYLSICYHNKEITHRNCCYICHEEDDRLSLQCCACHKLILEKNHYKRSGDKPYCLDCFGKFMCKNCSNCLKSIGPTQLEVKFGDWNFHRECFECFKCLTTLNETKEVKFYVDKESTKPCCVDCYAKLYCKKCLKCLMKIDPAQTGILYADKVFHRDCFCCHKCKTRLYQEGKRLRFFKDDHNNPICEKCYEKHFCKSCTKCSGVMYPTDLQVFFQKKSYHKPCFCCSNCDTKLMADDNETKIEFFVGPSDQPLCIDCFGKLMCKDCITCKRKILPGQKSLVFKNQVYHDQCFCCDNCHTKLSAGENQPKIEFLVGSNEQPLCIDCYGKLMCKECVTCKKPILPGEKSLIFKNKNYHMNSCFKCFNCSTNLKEEKFFEHNNEPCCIVCLGKFSDSCVDCKKPVLPNNVKITFENSLFHKECFKCCSCATQLGDTKFTKDHNNKPICIECHSKIYSKKCLKCSDFILPNQAGLTFEDRFCHKDCFSCIRCFKKLSSHGDHVNVDNVIFFKDEKGFPMCIECYEISYCDGCEKCGKKISPNSFKMEYEDKKYHSTCLVCTKCAGKILDINEIKKDEKGNILCGKCSKVKEKTPPKAKAGPGKLNFGQIGNFEKKTDFKCVDCGKVIQGQKFLTNKVGSFLCKKCNSKNEASCFMCKKVFESREEFFKDETNNNYCEKCIKIYQKQKKEQAQ